MLSQFGQKKKKEALRRLSQNAAHRQSLEGKTSKRTATFRQKLSPESLSAAKGPSGLIMKSVEHGEVDSKTQAFEMANAMPSVFGNVSTSSFDSSGSYTINQTFLSVPPNTQAISGFPVVTSTVVPTFPSTSHTGFGFPVSSTFTTLSAMTTDSSVGFPVSTAKFVGFSSFRSNDNSSKPKDFEENKTKTSTGFPVKPVDTFPVKSDDNTFVSGSEQRRDPLHQTQSFTSLSNVKSFGTKQTVQEEKITLPDISKLKSLVIREIPPGCNKNTWLRRFYSRFGEIVKVLCNSAKNSATVTFRTHEAAKLAKVKGRILQKGCQPVSIFWKQEKKRSVSKDKQELSEKAESVKQNIGEKPVLKEAVLSFDVQSLPVAISSGDKYKVLEMIDLKFREGLTKASDITTAKAVKGTCPDMCPEKERYMREDRRRLHTFEIVPGTGSMEENPLIEHARAVKEYDRSAADKEEPLPHELRPVKTLQMTMDYLVTNIMDVGEGRWAEWFDFLWNRTRAIRKDITQQHLCEPNAVDLIEKTARFHIFCSHYLCDQDFGVFDPKINTENLTKCLQTLKHFYDDLYKNQNITCPCEAEFRAYDILLNLNEGDILRQVMTYRKEVRSSPLVQFAMGIFNALNSNNSVRFFRLVRSSTYLCACLLHRYFTQVRQQAIRILNYSLSVPNKEMSYPLSELAQMLVFEDDDEAAMFCRFHGMTVNEPNVVFMRGSFIEPEAAFPLAKSLRLIESKRTSLIGEIVYNGPLPPNPNHKPTSSFNSNGQYIGDGHILPTSPKIKALSPKGFSKESHTEEGSFGVTKSPFQGFSQTQSCESNETLKPSVQINAEELKEVTKTLFVEVINELLVDITNDAFEKLLTMSNDIAREIEECSVSILIQEIVKSVILDEQRQQNMEAEQAAQREKASSTLASDIVNEVIEEELYRSASSVYNIEHQKLVQRYEELATQQISQNILEQTVLDEIQKTVHESFKELKSLRKSTLQKISNSFMVTRKERYFKRWIKSYHSLVKLKRLLSNFPSHCSLASPEQQLSQLIGPQFDAGTCTFHTTRILRDEQNISKTLSQRQAVLEKNRSEVLRSIDIPQLIAGLSSPQFFTKTTVKSCIDWKLLLSFRNPCQDLDYPVFNQSEAHVNLSVIREKFSKGTITEKTADSLSGKLELLSLYSAEVPSRLSTAKRCRICTLASYGILSNTDLTNLTSSRQLQGTSAILIITESSELLSYSHRQDLRIRVQRLLQSKPDIPAIPVVILFLDNSLQQHHITQDAVIDAVGIHHHSNHISEATVIMLPSITEIQILNDVLQEAVTWLLQRSNDQLELESNSLKNYVEEGMQRYFWTSFYDDFATRKRAGLNDQCPEALIAMYNAVIEHLASVASSSKLCRVSWPIKEFCKAESRGVPHIDWNSEPSLSSLRSVILSLLLPLPPPRAENGLWDSEALLCQLYVQQIPQNSTYLAQRIDRLLHHKRLSLHESQLSAEEVPWTQVIEASISSLMTSLYSDPVLSNTEVYFFVNEIDAFEQPEIWQKAAFSSKEESTFELEKKRIQRSSSMTSKDALIYESVQVIDKDLEAILKNSKMRSVEKKKQTTSLENSIIDLKGKLGTALLEARDDIISFEKDIQRWLPESSKKRKAEAILHFQIPIMKSSRHSTDNPS